jgi:hypothetical protein
LWAREERVPRILRPNRHEVKGGRRRLNNEELYNLYSSPNINKGNKLRKTRWAGYVTRMGLVRNAYKILIGRYEGKRLLWRIRRIGEDNIKMGINVIGRGLE